MGKKELPSALKAAAEAHPDKRIALYFQDGRAPVTLDRVGQKGRVCHRWWLRGQRPPGLHDNRFEYAYIFAAVEPATGNDFCLVLPSVSTHAMSVFLRGFSEQLAPDVHAVLVLDGAGWHIADALQVPDNVTLVKLPPYAPELNPVERVWLYLRERFLSHRLHTDQDAFMDAACKAWSRLTPERLSSLCNYPWIREVSL